MLVDSYYSRDTFFKIW